MDTCKYKECEEKIWATELCRRHYHVEWKARHPGYMAAAAKKHRENNLEAQKAKQKAFRDNNKEKVAASNKRWRDQNKEYLQKTKRQYAIENAEYLRGYYQKYRLTHKNELGKYYQSRKERLAAVKREKFTDGEVLEIYGTNCHICGEPIDLTAPRLIGRADGPGWEKSLHVDHVIPISLGGDDTLANVRPSHALCNLRKGNRSTFTLF